MERPDITIRLFGQFRNYFRQSEITVSVSSADTLSSLKTKLAEIPLEGVTQENLRSLLDSSVFATDTRILNQGDDLPDDSRLALLPPVSGG